MSSCLANNAVTEVSKCLGLTGTLCYQGRNLFSILGDTPQKQVLVLVNRKEKLRSQVYPTYWVMMMKVPISECPIQLIIHQL